MKENKGKRFRLPSNKFLAALVVVALTVGSLAVTSTLLGCNEEGEAITIFCKGCAQQVKSENTHAVKCGEAEHYHCDGFTHGLADCGEHNACIDAIAKYEAEIDPTKQEINALATIKANYSKAEAELHTAADCGIEGHFKCDGKEHSEENCKSVPEHEHTFGKATCISPATCTVDGCNETTGEKDTSNHTGGTEVKNKKNATCSAKGYSGDTHCKGCNAMLQKGSETAKSTTHSGGTEVKNAKAATCCEAGFSGDTYCKGCGAKISSGSSVAATGQHPAAVCCKSGHHAHDNKNHAGAECQILGHYVCDGKNHADWACVTDADYDRIIGAEITIANPGTTWSYTIGGHTVSNSNLENYEHEVLLGGYSIKVYMTTLQGYTFTIDTTNGKKVYIDDYSEDAGYNDKVVNGEDPVTITVSKNMLKAEMDGDYTYYTLFITIKE